MKNFFKGFFFVFRGFKELKTRKGLLKWFIAPLIVNLILLTVFLSTGLGYVDGFVATAMGYITFDGWFFEALKWVLDLLFSLAFIILIVYLVFILSTVISAPFNALMAENILLQDGVISEAPFNAKTWVSFTLKMLWASLIKAMFFLGVAVVAFIVGFMPGLNFFAIFLSLLVIAFDCFDYAFEVMGMNFKQRKMFFSQNLLVGSGMAIFLLVTMIIPGLIIIVLPLGVIGASSLVKELS